jgi:hypothetical protein
VGAGDPEDKNQTHNWNETRHLPAPAYRLCRPSISAKTTLKRHIC